MTGTIDPLQTSVPVKYKDVTGRPDDISQVLHTNTRFAHINQIIGVLGHDSAL